MVCCCFVYPYYFILILAPQIIMLCYLVLVLSIVYSITIIVCMIVINILWLFLQCIYFKSNIKKINFIKQQQKIVNQKWKKTLFCGLMMGEEAQKENQTLNQNKTPKKEIELAVGIMPHSTEKDKESQSTIITEVSFVGEVPYITENSFIAEVKLCQNIFIIIFVFSVFSKHMISIVCERLIVLYEFFFFQIYIFHKKNQFYKI